MLPVWHPQKRYGAQQHQQNVRLNIGQGAMESSDPECPRWWGLTPRIVPYVLVMYGATKHELDAWAPAS